MFDSRLRPLIDPPLNRVARLLARTGVSANKLSILGLFVGLLGAAAVVAGWFWFALVLIALNRLADGLDGPLARLRAPNALGGYYDIVFDFFFYGAVPLAFALHDPDQNALSATILIASFYANGSTFLAFSALAAKTGRETSAQGKKAIYYFAGLTEGAETIAVFAAVCVWPEAFPIIATVFAALCLVSAVSRVIMVRAVLSDC